MERYRLRVLLPDAMVSVFLYDPSVGMTLKITPDGQETGYSYDTKGRLGEVFTYDECGHKSVIEAYDYNIVNE